MKAARAKELEFFSSKGVWMKVPRQRSFSRTGKPPISVRWVDVKKGDGDDPKYWSSLVARQFKATDFSGKSYFAPAPPLGSLRAVTSMALTTTGGHRLICDPKSSQRIQISFVDVKRAYFNAKVGREASLCVVDLPPEEPDAGKMCA